MTVQIVPFSCLLSNEAKLGIEELAKEKHPENSDVQFFSVAHEDTAIPPIKGGANSECSLVFAMTSTPEAEVQGRFIEEIKAKCKSISCPLNAIVDSSKFLELFSYAPQRIEERKKNWSNFLSGYGLTFIFADLSRLDLQQINQPISK